MRKLIILSALALLAGCQCAPVEEQAPQQQEGQADPEVQPVPSSGN